MGWTSLTALSRSGGILPHGMKKQTVAGFATGYTAETAAGLLNERQSTFRTGNCPGAGTYLLWMVVKLGLDDEQLKWVWRMSRVLVGFNGQRLWPGGQRIYPFIRLNLGCPRTYLEMGVPDGLKRISVKTISEYQQADEFFGR